MNDKIFERLSNMSYIYLDDFGNVIYEADFTIVLGKVDESFRFVPKSNTTLEQGLTTQMLTVIANLIRKKDGTGEKRDE